MSITLREQSQIPVSLVQEHLSSSGVEYLSRLRSRVAATERRILASGMVANDLVPARDVLRLASDQEMILRACSRVRELIMDSVLLSFRLAQAPVERRGRLSSSIDYSLKVPRLAPRFDRVPRT